MRAVFLFLLLVMIACSSQKTTGSKKNPPGTIRINDTLFVDEAEISNVAWREYEAYIRDFNQDGEVFQSRSVILPDTLVWNNNKTFSEPLSEFYFRHPGFNDYPIVGITYEQAIEFCKWRTHAVNQLIYFREKGIKGEETMKHLKDSFPTRIVYRLLSEKEWEMVADKSPDSLFDKKGRRKFNTKEEILAQLERDRHYDNSVLYTRNVISYYPNSFKLYNLFGNVAEMVAEEGVAKGGSFEQPFDSCRIEYRQYYTQPEKWLGFRCAAVIRK